MTRRDGDRRATGGPGGEGAAWLKEMMRDRRRGRRRGPGGDSDRQPGAQRAARRGPRSAGPGRRRDQGPRRPARARHRRRARRRPLDRGQGARATRRGRLDDVDPQSRVAAVLAGRDEVHPAETLMLRARLDLQQGRHAEARYGLRAARAALEERARRAPEGAAAGAGGDRGEARRRSRAREPARTASRSATTSPSIRTAASASNGVGPLVITAMPPPLRSVTEGNPATGIDLERGADAEHQVGARGEGLGLGHRLGRKQLAEEDDVGLHVAAAA